MIMLVRYFFEKSDEGYQQYIAQWNEYDSRMIFLGIGLSETKQMTTLLEDIQNNPNKDILAIRFPDKEAVVNNDILKKLQLGEGITHADGVWYPNEIWIYNPL
uniref:Uncharacterized protein n=1 Tax=viral metagenome TaxID=1070528 RepID=A0A6C0AZD5_9ZZZZ